MRLIDADALLYDVIGITDGWLKPQRKVRSFEDMIRTAPTVLETDPVQPKKAYASIHSSVPETIYLCGACGHIISGNYCANCGRKIGWIDVETHTTN